MTQPNVNIPDIIRGRSASLYNIGRTPVWDFRTGDFVVNDQGRLLESRRQTMLQIVFSELLTEFTKYPIYRADFGSELHTLIGQDEDLVRTLLPTMVNEALNDPRLTHVEVNGSSIQIEDSVISFSLSVADISGNAYTRQIRIA